MGGHPVLEEVECFKCLRFMVMEDGLIETKLGSVVRLRETR